MEAADQLFYKIVAKNRLVPDDALADCAREAGDGRPLGDLLLERGLITEKHHRQIQSMVEAKLGPRAASFSITDDEGGAAEEEAEAAPAHKHAPAAVATAAPAAPPALRGAPVGALPRVIDLLREAKDAGASDLHLSCGAKPFVRLHGQVRFLERYPVIDPQTAETRILEAFSPELRARFAARNDIDTCLEIEGTGRFRANVLRQRRGVSAVFRVIRDKVPSLEELGLPDTLKRFTTYQQGIVLVTGAAGSGKSSTLAALIEIVNQTRKDHVITLEDPIEYVFSCKKANVSQRQVELHTASWGSALRAALREDPDVIMVGEMRDLDTMRLAVTAAETGHLVLATLHTTNATRTIDRLLDVFPPKEQPQIRAMVSESLRGVISQQLVPRADARGRVAAVEILFSTPAVANLIREKRTFQLFSVLQTGKKLGMKLMDDSLADLVAKGTITKDEARFRSTNPKRFAS